MTGLVTPGARLIDGLTGREYRGDGLRDAVDAIAAGLAALPDGLLVCLTRTDIASVLRYLGALAADRPVLLYDREAPASEIIEVVARFEPVAVLGLEPAVRAQPARGLAAVGGRLDPPAGYRLAEPPALGAAWLRDAASAVTPHPDLSLLLATSGSTGRPRLVRQSAASVRASAIGIIDALRIDASAVALTSLPLYFTLGLSVLHSHLLAGATIVVEGRGVLDPGFWRSVTEHRVTTITGVPHTVELLRRQPWRPEDTPSVRSLCVSGGRLRDETALHYHDALTARGRALFVMYGQTEAGSRICVLPPERLPAKLGSVGPPVPGTRLSLMDSDATGIGEVVCHSATVMMGYADTVDDLARGDDQRGRLRTGDRGRLDADGYLWLVGRAGRIGKAYGVRVSLDAVEQISSAIAPTAAVAGDDRVLVWCEGATAEQATQVAVLVAEKLRIHRTALRVDAVPSLPRRPNGKVDYDALRAACGAFHHPPR